MSAFTNHLKNEMLDHILGGGDYVRPATVYLALFLTAPDSSGNGEVEAVGGDYARVAVANNSTNFPAAVDGVKTNGAAITFAQPTASWGTIKAVGVYDAATGGNLLMWAYLSQQVAIASEDNPEWPAGTLTFSLQ